MEPTEVTPQIRGHSSTRTPISRVLAHCAFLSPYWAECEGPPMPSQGDWPKRNGHVWTEQVRAKVGAGWAGKGGYFHNLSPTRSFMDCLGQTAWHLIAFEGKTGCFCLFVCLRKRYQGTCVMQREMKASLNGELRTIRKQEGKAAPLGSLEH